MAPRGIEANEEIKDERSSQILLAALKVFTRKGFSAAKMSDIAAEAGVSYGLAYHYFRSKDDIFKELVNHAVNSIGRIIDEYRRCGGEPVEQIRKIVDRVCGSVANKEASGYYYVLVLNAITSEASPVCKDEIIEKSAERFKGFVKIISEGQKKGQVKSGSPEEIAVTAFSTLVGLASLEVSGVIKKIPDTDILMRLFI